MNLPVKKPKYSLISNKNWDENFEEGVKVFESFYSNNPTIRLLKKVGNVKPVLFVVASGGLPVKEALDRLVFEVIPFDANGDRAFGITWNPRTQKFSLGFRASKNIDLEKVVDDINNNNFSIRSFQDHVWTDASQALWEYVSSPEKYKNLALVEKNKTYQIKVSGGKILFRTPQLAIKWIQSKCQDWDEDAFRICQSWNP